MTQFTREMLEAAAKMMAEQAPVRRHYCSLDGHVELFCSRRCAMCHEVIRDRLTVDENHVLLREFF